MSDEELDDVMEPSEEELLQELSEEELAVLADDTELTGSDGVEEDVPEEDLEPAEYNPTNSVSMEEFKKLQ